MLNQNKVSKFNQIFDYLHEHIIAVIIIVAILAGGICTAIILNDQGDANETETSVTEYQPMKTVYFAMDKVSSLNPLSSTEEDTYYISKLVFSSLFRLDETLNIEKDLVKKYTANSKSGTVSLTLRNDAVFSDGNPLTAHDVRFTVEQIQSIGEKSPYYEYISKIETVETDLENPNKLTIKFKKVSDAALDNLVFPIVSEQSFKKDEIKPVGSGQYAYGSYTNKKVLKLKANKHYYGEPPVNSLQFKVISDKSNTPGLMTIDSITATVTTDTAVSIEAEDKGLQTTSIPSNEVEYIGFNFKNQYLKDVRVRQAIAKIINCKSIIHDSYGGAGMESDSVYYPGFLGYENKGDAYEQDQVGASQLLKDCGFIDSDENGFLENKNGKEVELTILVNRNNDSRVDAAETICSELNKIGIKASVKSLSWKKYKEALEKKKFDLYLGGYQFDQKYNLKALFSKNNKINYKNEDVLAYVKQLEKTLTAEEQKEVYGKLKTVLTEELPYYCICYKTYSFISVERFKADTIPTFFQRYRGCDTWQWEKVMTTKIEDEEQE